MQIFYDKNNAGNTQGCSEMKRLKLLRSRFYMNLSYLDSAAKIYGEMTFFYRYFLNTIAGGLAVFGIIFLNPVLFFSGALFLQLLWILSIQYKTMESRFSLMVRDLEEVDKQLHAELKQQAEIKQSLFDAISSNKQLTLKLNILESNLSAMKEKVRLKESALSAACDSIEVTAQQTKDIMVNLVSAKGAVELKEQEIVDELSNVSFALMQSLPTINNNFDEREIGLQQARQYRENVTAFLRENFPETANIDNGLQRNDIQPSFFRQ